MKPVEITDTIPGYEPITYAKDQPEYIPLPALRQSISEKPTPQELASWHGAVLSRWRPTTEELEKLMAGDDICLENVDLRQRMRQMRGGAGSAAGEDRRLVRPRRVCRWEHKR